MAAEDSGEAPPQEGHTRLKIDFGPEAVERLEQLKAVSGADSNGRVIADSLRFYEWYLKTKGEGGVIQVQKGDEVVEVEFDWSEQSASPP